MMVVTRAAAKASGLLTYFSGRMCPLSHECERYVSTGNCVDCAKAHSASRRDYYRENYRRNRARRIEQGRARYLRRPAAEVTASARKWAEANPEKRRAIANSYKHRRRCLEAGGMSTVELDQWTRDQPKICHWCGTGCTRDFQVDHVIPLSKGGKHEASNLVIACLLCNRRKNARMPEEFMQLLQSGHYEERRTVNPAMIEVKEAA